MLNSSVDRISIQNNPFETREKIPKNEIIPENKNKTEINKIKEKNAPADGDLDVDFLDDRFDLINFDKSPDNSEEYSENKDPELEMDRMLKNFEKDEEINKAKKRNGKRPIFDSEDAEIKFLEENSEIPNNNKQNKTKNNSNININKSCTNITDIHKPENVNNGKKKTTKIKKK